MANIGAPSFLPDAVRARTRVVVEGAPKPRGYVVYWMRVAVRDHENPALDAAVAAANALGSGVLVYHGVSERYPYASDRHHTFMLEGARDVARGLRNRGIAYALHVERHGARGPMLRRLAERAALVVTEEAPVPPLTTWTARLAAHLSEARVPLWTVDASCVVPMPLLRRRYDRAYSFRSDTRRLAAASLAEPWRDVEASHSSLSPPPLPFEPVEAEGLDDRGIARLVAACDIDHGVGPVRALRGGSTAGYARWSAFKTAGLSAYAARRNDAAIDGTSRLSPYLHYGHVSPFRIARDAARETGLGAEKLLDELLTWRELAWHFAFHTPRIDSLHALPSWALETLEAHAGDARDVLPFERLELARTGDPLWDLAQRSLLAHGELHNNVRMTWGKAIVGWTATPEAARKALVELNNRYALDGRDPSSYGGLYWCLGLFDRPFSPERPVLGTIRARPTSVHAQRLNGSAYAARVLRPSRKLRRVAIVGAGVAGLACGRTLAQHNVEVVLFDKGKAPGGRLASRRCGEVVYDLGAQYFTAKDPRFARLVESWREEGIVAMWEGRVRAVGALGREMVETEPVARFVGAPRMSALARHLARDLDVRSSHRVDRLEASDGRWVLSGAVAASGVTLGPRRGERDIASGEEASRDLGDFDAVLVCTPAAQAQALLDPDEVGLDHGVTFDACVALGLQTDELEDAPFDGLFVGRDGDPDRVIGWVARDSSKPGREGVGAFVVHAAPEWSARHFGDSEASIQAALLDALARLVGRTGIRATSTTLQRWRFAKPRAARAEVWFDDERRLGAGGDWTGGGRVEGAFLSGVALAGRVLGLSEQT